MTGRLGRLAKHIREIREASNDLLSHLFVIKLQVRIGGLACLRRREMPRVTLC